MELTWFITSLSKISRQSSFRPDPKYRKIWDVFEAKLFPISHEVIPFTKVLEEIKVSKIKKGVLDEECFLLNISDQPPRAVFLNDMDVVSEIGSDKNPLWDSDIIISKLGLPKGYIFLNDKERYPRLIGSSELIPYKIVDETYLPKFLKYFLMHEQVLKVFSGLESGKTPSHKRVNPVDILNTFIPKIDKKLQENAVSAIDSVENEIYSLYKSIVNPLLIINESISRFFKFDKALWKDFGKGMTAGTQKSDNKRLRYFSTPVSQVLKSNIFRFSTRFHNPFTQQLMDVLASHPTFKVNEVLSEKVVRGVQPKFEPDGDIYAIKTAQLKNGFINLEDCEMVSVEFYDNNKKAQLRNGDIVMASTGKVSLGKVDLVEFEDDAIADGHISIIRIDDTKYNKQFFVYFFRSILGAFQIERDFTGATNQIDLYPGQIEAFLIPDIPLSKQAKIVEEIKLQLDSQKDIEIKIAQKQDKISRIIEDAIILKPTHD